MLKNIHYLLIGLVLLCSCSSEKDKSASFKFRVIDSTLLDEREHPIQPSATPLDFMNNYGSFLNLIAYNPNRFVSYGNTGIPELVIDKNNSKNYLLPTGVIGGFYTTKEFAYILYPIAKTIVKFSKKGEFIEKYAIELPDNLEFARVPNLLYDEKKDIFIIGISLAVYQSKNEYYTKSPVIGIFAKNGKMITKIGTYPKEYLDKGNYFQSCLATCHFVKDENFIYLLFPHTHKIQKFSFSGELVETFDIKSEYMDYSIHFHEKEIDEMPEGQEIKQNDYYFSLALDSNSEKLYVLGRKKYQKFIGCFNQKNKTYQESLLPIKAPLIQMMPEVKNDTLYFYPLFLNSDEKYIIKFTCY